MQTTMREANDRGYECLLLEDCTESYFPAFKQATIEMVRAQGGIVGWTTHVGRTDPRTGETEWRANRRRARSALKRRHRRNPHPASLAFMDLPASLANPEMKWERLHERDRDRSHLHDARPRPLRRLPALRRRREPAAPRPHRIRTHLGPYRRRRSTTVSSATPARCLIHPPGTSPHRHPPAGCLVLAVWEKPVVFLEKSPADPSRIRRFFQANAGHPPLCPRTCMPDERFMRMAIDQGRRRNFGRQAPRTGRRSSGTER